MTRHAAAATALPGGRRDRGAGPRRRLRPRLVAAAVLLLLVAAITTRGVSALLADKGAGGPEALVAASLTPAPTTATVTNRNCSGTNQSTNLGVAWTDAQSATTDAAGGSLITGFTVRRAAMAWGPYAVAGAVTGSPSPTTFTDTPTIANTPVALVANGGATGSKQIYPVAESTLTAGSGMTIGTASNEVNAIQIAPDGVTAVVAESGTGQVQILTWSGAAWAITKTIALVAPTAVAIDPVPNVSGYSVAYVVSDPGAATNGAVYPITLNGGSSTIGSAISIQHQADPTAIAVTPNGAWAYVTNFNSHTVSAINTATSAVTTVALPGANPQPVAVAATFDSSHVYVADRANGSIDDIRVASNTVTARVTLAAGGLSDTIHPGTANPNLLALLPDGKTLYVAEFGAAQVQLVNTALASPPDTISATIPTGSGSKPVDLAMTPNGCLVYAADWSSGRILSINTTTRAESSVFTTTCGTQDPQPMEVTPDNQKLLIPENRLCGDLEILDTATSTVTTLGTVGTSATMVAIPPIPIWYEVTASHSQWTSNASFPARYPVGWNPGGWQ